MCVLVFGLLNRNRFDKQAATKRLRCCFRESSALGELFGIKSQFWRLNYTFLLALLPSAGGSDRTHCIKQSQTREWAPPGDEKTKPKLRSSWRAGAGHCFELEVATWQFYVPPWRELLSFSPSHVVLMGNKCTLSFYSLSIFFGTRPGSLNSSSGLPVTSSHCLKSEADTSVFNGWTSQHISNNYSG